MSWCRLAVHVTRQSSSSLPFGGNRGENVLQSFPIHIKPLPLWIAVIESHFAAITAILVRELLDAIRKIQNDAAIIVLSNAVVLLLRRAWTAYMALESHGGVGAEQEEEEEKEGEEIRDRCEGEGGLHVV
jgi:hypothetical protein